MADKELENLARQYAETENKEVDFVDEAEREFVLARWTKDVTKVLRWLSKSYYIVSREKVNKMYEVALSNKNSQYISLQDTGIVQLSILAAAFGNPYLKNQNKNDMSMIEEKIDKATEEYTDSVLGLDYIGEVAVERAFKAGAKWALSHQWISVEDALPETNEDVLVMEVRGNYHNLGVAWCDNNHNGTVQWYSDDDDLGKEFIRFWMPIPPLPEARKEDAV